MRELYYHGIMCCVWYKIFENVRPWLRYCFAATYNSQKANIGIYWLLRQI